MTLTDIQKIIGSWSIQTFGKFQKPHEVHLHLIEECDELFSHLQDGEDKFNNSYLQDVSLEMADIIILLIGLAERHGISLESAILQKHMINLQRRWNPPDENGLIHHAKDDQA